MNAMKSLLALSVSALAVGGAANAATVGSYSVVVAGAVVGTLPPAFGSLKVNGTIAGTGTALLDSAGTLAVTDSQVATTSVGGAAPTSNTTGNISNFTGSLAGSVFTSTAGSATTTSCVPAGTGCNILLATPTNSYITAAGTVAAPGGVIVTTIGEFGGAVTATETWTFTSTAPAVPLPPAVWLLGSGLVGLVGTARRRRVTKA